MAKQRCSGEQRRVLTGQFDDLTQVEGSTGLGGSAEIEKLKSQGQF